MSDDQQSDDQQDSKDPNLDTFDHLGARARETPIQAIDGIHIAGPRPENELGVQLCTRCDGILADYRLGHHAPTPTGWAPGAHVEISGGEATITTAAANCSVPS